MPIPAIKDEAIWDKAKTAAAKSKKISTQDLQDGDYALVMDIYKKMGGEIKGKKEMDANQHDKSGFSVYPNIWQLASQPLKKTNQKESSDNDVKPLDGDERAVNDLLVQNPGMSGATLLNLLKSKGYKIVSEMPKQEAEVTSGHAPLLRAKAKESLIEGGPGSGRHPMSDHVLIDAKGKVTLKKPKTAEDSVKQMDAMNDLLKGAQRDAEANPSIDNKLRLNHVIGQYSRATGYLQDHVSSAKELLKNKESNPKQARGNIVDSFAGGFKFIEAKLQEGTAARDNGVGYTRFRAVLLKEGLGNKKDGFYYTKNALRSAAPVFEGKKIYADHPSMSEEKDRPERSVRDVLGHYENVSYEESDDGTGQLSADVVTMPDEPYRWARALMSHSVQFSQKYPDKDFIGVSINASGDANPMKTQELLESSDIPDSAKPKIKEALDEGLDTVRLVTTIREAISADLVTEAGAGGSILNFLERNKEMEKHEKHESEKDKHEKKEGDQDQQAVGHDDAEQDKELIKSMLKKHLGHGDDSDGDGEAKHESESEAEMKHAMEAYEYMKQAGHKPGEEAAKMAASAVKCAKHMAAKRMESEGKDPLDKQAKGGDQHFESDGDGDADDMPKKDKQKESEKITKLIGEVAALKEAIRKREVADYLEEKLEKSGLPRHATKSLRESIKTPRTKEEVDHLLKVFNEGYKSSGEASRVSFAMGAEKNVVTSDGAEKISFGNCKR